MAEARMDDDTLVIRRATQQDMPGLEDLLGQVLDVHHAGRPDLFRANARKYTTAQLAALICDDDRPIFVAADKDAEPGTILGYAFCVFQQHKDDNILTDVKTLYIDDLCVDEAARGRHLGARLFEYVRDFAQKSGCYNLTLNVWALNEGAQHFYERMGMRPQKYGMETIL